MMKDIFVIDSYISSVHDYSYKLVDDMIDYLSGIGKEICLVSHLPIYEALAKKVRYSVYDSNNIIGDESIELWFASKFMKLKWNPATSYHGAAVYTNIYNSLKLLQDYSVVHFIEYDINLSVIPDYLKNIEKINFDVIGFPFIDNNQGVVSSIVTNLFSIRPEIVCYFPRIEIWKEYKDYHRDILFENWFYQVLKKAGARTYTLKPMVLGNIRSEGNVFIACTRNTEGHKVIFVIDLSDSQEVSVIFETGTHHLKCHNTISYVAKEDNKTFSVITNGNKVDYNIADLKINGKFKYFDGSMTCPDWDEE